MKRFNKMSTSLGVCAGLLAAVGLGGCGSRTDLKCLDCASQPSGSTLSPEDTEQGPVAMSSGGMEDGPSEGEPMRPTAPSRGGGEDFRSPLRIDEAPAVDPTTDLQRIGEPFFQPLDNECSGLVATEEQQLEVLRGCEEVFGPLVLRVPESDLEPLSNLVAVSGELAIEGARSLAGLRSLQRVGSLRVEGTELVDLQGLQSLSELGGATAGGVLNVSNNAQLESFVGLGSLEGVTRFFVVGNERLASLDGLTWEADLLELRLEGNPQLSRTAGLRLRSVEAVVLSSNNLTELSMLAGVQEIERLVVQEEPSLQSLTGLESLVHISNLLRIEATGVRSLDGLEQLRAVDRLILSGNVALTNARGLSGLIQVDDMTFERSDSLSSVASFPNVESFRTLSISSNPLLTDAPRFPQLFQADRIRFVDNASLEEIAGFVAMQEVSRMEISRNRGLVTLSLPALQTIEDILILRCNESLEPVRIDFLQSAEIGRTNQAGNRGEGGDCE